MSGQKFANESAARYLTLDDATVLSLARTDPAALVRGTSGLTVIDEVQMAPELFPEIKLEVDRNRQPGRFLLTGSANVLSLPKISESLAGRMEILPLMPLSQDEIGGETADFPAALLSGLAKAKHKYSVERLDICKRIIAGGFPEPNARSAGERRSAWFQSYLSSLVQRDLRDLANIEGLTDIPKLLGLMAARCGGLMNMSELSRTSDIAHATLRRYLGLLEAIFLFQPLPAWCANLGKRLVKAPKSHLIDSSVSAHLRGETDPRSLSESNALGVLLETFVPQAVAGIEVKATASINRSSFAGLESLAATAGKKFVHGAVIYLGEEVLRFSDRLIAVPIQALWRLR